MTEGTAPVAAPDAKVDFTSSWDGLWVSLTSGSPGIASALAYIAGIVALVTFVQWIWRSSKGNRDNKSLLWGLGIACILAAPGVVIPIALGVLQLIANTFLGLAAGAASGAGV